jgi:hypothetical protein
MPAAMVPDGGACAEESHEARRLPLDLLLLVDVSSSMANVVAGGTQSKWDIAREALLGFLRDPRTDGLQIALQFFPCTPPASWPTSRTSRWASARWRRRCRL